MPEAPVRVTIDHSVATLTIDRVDKRNALTRQMITSLTAAVHQATASDVRALVLRAEGPVFCAGMDLGEMQQRAAVDEAPDEWLVDSQVYCDLLLALVEAPFPTIAAVSGPVLAGGVGLVVACDLVAASRDCFFALPEPQRGITAAMVTPLLTYRVGAGHATELLLTADRISADTTLGWGLCQTVVDREQLPAAVDRWIASILASSPAALAVTKGNIRRFHNDGLVDQLRSAAAMSAEARGTQDAREGLQAFLEKRKPNWNTPRA